MEETLVSKDKEAERELIARVQIKTLTEECLYILTNSELGEMVWPEKYEYLWEEDERSIEVETRMYLYLKTFLDLNEESSFEDLHEHSMKNLEEILCIPAGIVYPKFYYDLVERLQGAISRICINVTPLTPDL